jgi:hypothetical protein
LENRRSSGDHESPVLALWSGWSVSPDPNDRGTYESVEGKPIAGHSGEQEVNAPSANEIAQEQHARDHLCGREFGVSGASASDDDDHAAGGDDKIGGQMQR